VSEAGDAARRPAREQDEGQHEGAPHRAAPHRDTPEQAAPHRGTPEQAAPRRGTPEQAAPHRGTPEQAAPHRGTPEQAAPRADLPPPGGPRPAAGAAGRPPAQHLSSPGPGRAAAQASAVLDTAHLGDIEGALGRVRLDDDQYSGWRRRLVTFLAIMGPGLIVMVGDNDAGGVSTYAQAGQNYGYSLLWVLLLLIPVLIVNQEMVVRLGAVTGVGHARLINERFGRFWGWFSVGDLFLLNFLTIVTEFIGVSLALRYFGVSPYISVPLTAVLLVGITMSGSFRRWERAIFLFIATSLVLYPLALLSGPHYGAIFYHLVVPGIQGGTSSTAILLIIAIVGTTVAPWQLFFQQSNVVDKRITPRFIGYERADTTLGAFVVVAGAIAIEVVAVFAVRGTHLIGKFTDALGVARALEAHGYAFGALFAIVLLDASIIGASAVTLSTSYAFGDVFGLKHSLHRSFRDARQFYLSYAALVVVAAGIVLIPRAPLGLITTSVQALAGVLLPSASVFLLLLCNDREVLGPWVNHRWLNILAGIIIGVLLTLSGTLVVSTVFRHLNVIDIAAVLAGALLVSGGGAGLGLKITQRRGGRARPAPVQMTPQERTNWRMPPLALLKPVAWSPGTKLGVLLLRGYLVVSVILLVVKAVQLGGA
jgi:Mn2+/Fe2+ NRAMP family transporter